MKCIAPEKCGAFYYRAGLSREAQIIYDKMYAQFLRKDYSGVTKFHAGDADKAVEDSFSAYRALKKDHPEFFSWETKFVIGSVDQKPNWNI